MNLQINKFKNLFESNALYITDQFLSRYVNLSKTTVISGFWRSGTTYLMELMGQILGTRTFFEPFSYRVSEALPYHSSRYIFQTTMGKTTETYPYISPNLDDSVMNSFLDRMMAGKVSNHSTRRNRKLSLRLRKQVTIKLVRGNLLIAYLQKRYRCPILFLLRHPCAVISSIVRQKGGAPDIKKVLESESFLKILLSQQKLVDGYLYSYMEHIEKCKSDPIARIALNYAITQIIPLIQSEKSVFHPIVLTYEELILKPEQTLKKIANYLHLDHRLFLGNIDHQKNSSTTKQERKSISMYDRCFSWKNDLTKHQIDKIYAVCNGFDQRITSIIEKIDCFQK